MRPVCIPCEMEMACTKVGAFVESMTADGPYQIWSVDVYTCPVCKCEVGAKMANSPIARHFEPTYEAFAKSRYARAWGSMHELSQYAEKETGA